MKKLLLTIIMIGNVYGFTLDKKVEKNDSAWLEIHDDIPTYMSVAVIGTALMSGNESRFGKTTWEAMDSLLVSSIATTALKHTLTRERPYETEGETGGWFKGAGKTSFPSGHTSSVTSIVTPYILEYGQEYPAVYALALLPIHQMVGRVNAGAHWQSDVIVGALIGVASGYYAHSRDFPLTLSFDSDRVFVGWGKKF